MSGDNQGLVFVSFEELIGVDNRPGLLGVRDRTFGEVGVGGLQ